MNARALRPVAVVELLVVVSGPAAAASPPEAALREFKAAMDRVDRQDWAGAVVALERAVEIHPQADGDAFVLRYGRLTRNYYLPYYYLGLAAYESGDRRRAAVYLAEAVAQGEVAAHAGLRKRLEKMRRQVGEAALPGSPRPGSPGSGSSGLGSVRRAW